MQVTIDIPEPMYRELEDRATRQHRPLADVVIGEVLRVETDEEFKLRMKNRYPLIRNGQPGGLQVTEEGFNDLMIATDDELA